MIWNSVEAVAAGSQTQGGRGALPWAAFGDHALFLAQRSELAVNNSPRTWQVVCFPQKTLSKHRTRSEARTQAGTQEMNTRATHN